MVVVLFRNHPKEGLDAEEYGKLSLRMLEIVSKMPGFVSVDLFSGRGGESLVLAKFESADAVAAWRNQPDHLLAQGRRDDFYADYTVQVCSVDREYAWQS